MYPPLGKKAWESVLVGSVPGRGAWFRWQGRSHHMSPDSGKFATFKGELTMPFAGGLRCQACWQALGCYLRPPESYIVLLQLLRVKKRSSHYYVGTEMKSVLLGSSWCELIKFLG